MGRHSGTLSLLSGCSSPTCSLSGRSRLTPYQTRSQHCTNERLQTRLVRMRFNASWLFFWHRGCFVPQCILAWYFVKSPCVSLCRPSRVVARGQLQCRPPFFILFRCSSKLHSLSVFFHHLLFFFAPVPLNSLSASFSFLSPPLPSCACVCECDSVMWWIFLAANHSVRRWGETSGHVQPASSRCLCFSQFSSL